jgi:hypothetical protein
MNPHNFLFLGTSSEKGQGHRDFHGPFCGSLLLSGGRILTTQHDCITMSGS